MNIVNHKPVARGVTQLMYVGDDEAVDGTSPGWLLLLKVGAVTALTFYLMKRK